MKGTGIIRKVDELGRIVLPIELRRTLEIGERDALEIFVDGQNVVLRKFAPCCVFCGNTEHLLEFKGKRICAACSAELPKE